VINFIKITPGIPGQMRKCLPNCYLTISGLAVTLTFDLLTSKSNQFIFVPNCTETVTLVKLPQAGLYRVKNILVYDQNSRLHRRTHGPPKNRMPPVMKTQKSTMKMASYSYR